MIAAIIIGVLLVVGGGVAAAILLLGGDDEGGGGGDDPLSAAQAFADAIEDGDCQAAADVSTDNLIDAASCEEYAEEIETVGDVSVGDAEIVDESDTEATATVPVEVMGSSVDFTLGLVNQDGEWLVDSIAGAGGEMPTDAPTSMPSMSIPSISIPSLSIPTIPSFTVPTGE